MFWGVGSVYSRECGLEILAFIKHVARCMQQTSAVIDLGVLTPLLIVNSSTGIIHICHLHPLVSTPN